MLINEQIKWLREYFIFSVTLQFMKIKPPKCTFNTYLLGTKTYVLCIDSN